MKRLIILQFIIGSFFSVEGQNFYGISMSQKDFKAANVKMLKVFLMKNNSDSTLLREDLYDTVGNILRRKIYSKKGNLTTQNTFEYDANDYLVKSTSADGISRLAVTNYTNDIKGNLLSNETIMDGQVIFKNKNEFDEKTHLVKTTLSSPTGNSKELMYCYDETGKMIKTVMLDKNNDSTVHFHKYNEDGKLLNTIVKDANGETSKFYSYNSNHLLTAIKTVKNKNGSKTTETETYNYYINGLTETYSKGIKISKPSEIQKAYYTFY